ncbi:MAG: metal-dependent hydrolase [Acidobacteriota bacterium]
MPTIVTHAAVPLGLRIALGAAVVSTPLTIAAAVASVVPDFDVAAFAFGIPYGHPFGHRGLSHSLAFAVLLGVVAAFAAPWLRSSRPVAFAVVAVSAASHGLLDAATNGGKGVALLAPFTMQRYFFPWRPIQVSPIGISRIFSSWGLSVALSELTWVWLPVLTVSLLFAAFRSARTA